MVEAGSMVAPLAPTLTLWDWRRRVAVLWQDIRAAETPEAGWTLWKDTRAELFAHHPQTPLDPGGALPAYFDYDPALRFAVDLAPAETEAPIYMPAGQDGDVALTPFATTAGLQSALGGELTLYWVGGYGGGRYLLDTIKSADHGTTPHGRTILDFNFAYNPSCYYSPRWVCPLSPRGNRLPAPVRGGEKGHL